jgi:arylsulfatase A-like enzyme
MKFSALLAATVLAATFLPAHTALAKPAGQQQETAAPPRNIIFVLVDDLRFDAMGFLTPGLKTPNIDFLAKNGVYFPNAVVTSSLCSPSRATILTGQTARNHRVVDNNNSSEAGLTFFPSYLQKAGYQTAFFGKWHMGDDTAAPRPGFDHWVSFKGQGTYFPEENLSPAQLAAGERQTINVDGKTVKRSGYITDELTDYAMNWLQKERDPSKPFFLYLSHKAVHSAAMPPDRYKNQYADLDIKLPASMANTPENNKGKPTWVLNERNSWHGVDFVNHGDRQSMTEMVRDYYRTLSPVDDSLGRILAYLKASHLDRNTLIVFYSDNGYLIGDHGLVDKRNAYEPSVRVPMLMYAPGLLPKGTTNPALVRNLDLAPTFLDLAHVARPSQMEGESVLPLAEGKIPASEWKHDFVYEYYWEWNFPQTPTTFAIERDRVKYIQYHGIWDKEELYDLSKDPEEMNNLIDNPAYDATKQTLRVALYAQLGDNNGRHAIPYTAKLGTGAGLRNKNAGHAADFPAEWYVEPNLPGNFRKMFGIGLNPNIHTSDTALKPAPATQPDPAVKQDK